MNPVLVVLILLGSICLWFLLSNIFKIVGDIVNIFTDDVKKTMFNKEKNDEK